MEKQKSGLGTAGLVLGIIGICTSFIPIINNLSFFMGVLAVIFGIIVLIKKGSKGKAIAVVILGILTIAITLSSQKSLKDTLDTMSGNKTDEILANSLDVTIGEYEVNRQEYVSNGVLKVKIKNKNNEKKSFNVKIEAVDSNGERINTDTIYASDLGSGQSQSFEMFYAISDEQINTYQNATYKILEVSMY